MILTTLALQALGSFGAGAFNKFLNYLFEQKAKDKDLERELKKIEILQKAKQNEIDYSAEHLNRKQEYGNIELNNLAVKQVEVSLEDIKFQESVLEKYYKYVESVKSRADIFIRSIIAVAIMGGVIVIGAYLGWAFSQVTINGIGTKNAETTVNAAIVNYSYFFYFISVTVIFFYFGNAFGVGKNISIPFIPKSEKEKDGYLFEKKN